MPFSCPKGRCYPRFTVVGAVKGGPGRGRFADFERFLHADERRVGVTFVAARQGQVREEHVNQSAGDFGEGVAVKEKKRRGAMTAKKEVECFEKGQRLVTRFFPFVPDLLMSFLIMAVLRASSFARSAVEADDKLPTPVLDKRGSGL